MCTNCVVKRSIQNKVCMKHALDSKKLHECNQCKASHQTASPSKACFCIYMLQGMAGPANLGCAESFFVFRLYGSRSQVLGLLLLASTSRGGSSHGQRPAERPVQLVVTCQSLPTSTPATIEAPNHIAAEICASASSCNTLCLHLAAKTSG